MRLFIFTAIIMVCMQVTPVYAYIGPGLGAGTLAVILGFIGAFFLAIFAVIWYPLKRIFKKKQAKVDKAGISKSSEK